MMLIRPVRGEGPGGADPAAHPRLSSGSNRGVASQQAAALARPPKQGDASGEERASRSRGPGFSVGRGASARPSPSWPGVLHRQSVGAPTDRRLVPSHGSAFAFACKRQRAGRLGRTGDSHVIDAAPCGPSASAPARCRPKPPETLRGMTDHPLVDAAGRRRSPATIPGHHRGRPPRNKGLRYPADPPAVEEIVRCHASRGARAAPTMPASAGLR
jgi:hypothetical protein